MRRHLAVVRSRRPAAAGLLSILLFGLLTGGAVGGCSAGATGGGGGGAMPAATGAAPSGMAMDAVMAGGALMTRAEADAAWASRPAFVTSAGDETQAAYAFALARPDVLQYMPCYCGCAGMEHRSNLDCFIKRRETRSAVVFEEHASYCDVCVRTALKARQMLADGWSLRQIRSAVDGSFGGTGAPGTHTELPPT